MRRTAHDRARVYGSLRSAHLERARALEPASLLHRRYRYDYDPTLAEGLDLVRGGTFSMAVTVVRSRLAGIEVNEPLLRPGLWKTAVAVTAARVSGRLRRSPVLVTTYAIENRDPYGPEHRSGWRGRVRRRRDRALSRYTARCIDRIAFGTAAARDLYAARLGRELGDAATALVPALPEPCACPSVPGGRDPDSVVFVGAFSPRKGLPQLAAAWPDVVERAPTARLTLVGKGELEATARTLADGRPEVSLLVDPPRTELHAQLRTAAVLVLLSQPSATWREQVGLPVVEGLAHGCTVVTTSETGLADWLAGHGHEVLAPAAPATEVATAITRALGRRRSAESVLADLPDVDGRLAADRWMFAPLGEGTESR